MTAPPARPVVVLGDVMTDVLTRLRAPIALGSDAAAEVALRGGGSAANTAAWLAVAGVPVTLVGRIGDDLLGREQAAELAGYGVTLRLAVDPARPTGTCVVLVGPDGERSMLPDRGANLALDPADVPVDAFHPSGHLHLSGYALLDPRPPGTAGAAAAYAVDTARSVGMSVSVDASSSAPLAAAGPGRFAAQTAGADLLLANAGEAQLLGPALGRYRNAVVKDGPRGAAWHRYGRTVAAVPAVPARVADTTGAGDAFAAGLLAGWLAGAEPAAALAGGVALAASCVTRVGARPADRTAGRPAGVRRPAPGTGRP